MMRRLIIDSIRNDPEWMNGNYTKQPRSCSSLGVLRHRHSGGIRRSTRRRRRARRPTAPQPAPERAVSAAMPTTTCIQWTRRATTSLVGLNASSGAVGDQLADDERNPPNRVLDREIKRVKNGLLLIPASTKPRSGTHRPTGFWKQDLAELLQSAPRRASSLVGQADERRFLDDHKIAIDARTRFAVSAKPGRYLAVFWP